METYEQLLETWLRSTAVMHIAHHTAAARYARASTRASAAVGGASSPQAFRTMTSTRSRVAATTSSSDLSATSAGTGAPLRRSLSCGI